MFWFILPIVVAGVAAAVASGEDDQKTSKKTKHTSEKEKRYLLEVNQFKQSEKKRLERKHKLCNDCISFSSDFHAAYSARKFIYKEQKPIEKIQQEITIIDQALIDIKLLEEKYEKITSRK